MRRIQFSFSRLDALKHISHLDLMRLFQRALRRSGLPLVYSEGYNPHMRFNLALPLPVNVTASEECGEVFLSADVTTDFFAQVLSEQIPEGLLLGKTKLAELDAPLLPSLVSAAYYKASLQAYDGRQPGFEQYHAALERLMAMNEILTAKKKKKQKRQSKQKITYVNVRPFIIKAYFSQSEGAERTELKMLLKAGNRGGISPFFIVNCLEKDTGNINCHNACWQIHRERLYQGDDQILQPLFEGM